MTNRLSLLLVFMMLVPSFSALAGEMLNDRTDIAHFDFLHDHDAESAEHAEDDTDISTSAASADCHHCSHCHSLSFFYISGYDSPSFYVRHHKKYTRHSTTVAMLTLSPDLRPPIV